MRLTLLVFVLGAVCLAATPDPIQIPIDSAWKKAVHDFTADKLKHSAWGLAHSERDYLVAMDLAAKENLKVDEEVVFAAAFLHDMGGFVPFEKAGVDHAVRGAEIVGDYLRPMGFPESKIPAVQAAILTHSYYSSDKPTIPEAIVLHDADALDFLGVISIARILSLTERESAAKDLLGGEKTLESLLKGAPQSLILPTSQQLGKVRANEMADTLNLLKAESFDFNAL